jgi:hypothetical protein
MVSHVRESPYDRPIPHAKNPNNGLQTTFRNLKKWIPWAALACKMDTDTNM